MFRLQLPYTQRLPLLTRDEFATLSEGELRTRVEKLCIPTFGSRRAIWFSQDIPQAPDIQLMVQEFQPCNGDILVKSWVGEDGKLQTTPHPPFAIADPESTLAEYRRYLETNWKDWAVAQPLQFPDMVRLYESELVRGMSPLHLNSSVTYQHEQRLRIPADLCLLVLGRLHSLIVGLGNTTAFPLCLC